MIYEIKDNKILNKELRENIFTNHRMIEHGYGYGYGQGHGHDHQHHENSGGHSHAHLIEGLKDCEYLISKGGGWRVVEDLKKYNIKTVFADEELIEDAVNKFISGNLKNDLNLICDHSEN